MAAIPLLYKLISRPVKYRLLIIVLIFCGKLLSSCVYSKVSLTTEEKDLIPYGLNKSISIFSNGNLADTVYFSNHNGYKKGFVPNFDFWWAKKVHNDTSAKRGYYCSLNASSNLKKRGDDNLNLYMIIHFTKRSDLGDLILRIEGFSEEIPLNVGTPKTIIFNRKYVERLCKSCVTKVIWKPNMGIVELVKNDGSVWIRSK